MPELSLSQQIRLEAARILAHQFRDHEDASAFAKAVHVLAAAIESGESDKAE